MAKKKRVEKKAEPKKEIFDILVKPNFRIPKTFGQKASDKLSKWAGSWTFILSFFVFLGLWMVANVLMWVKQWDPYPFILLNLVLSCLAAIQAPIILMSQNRTAQRDRLKAEFDYKVNRTAEKEIREIKSILLKRSKK